MLTTGANVFTLFTKITAYIAKKIYYDINFTRVDSNHKNIPNNQMLRSSYKYVRVSEPCPPVQRSKRQAQQTQAHYSCQNHDLNALYMSLQKTQRKRKISDKNVLSKVSSSHKQWTT